MTAGSPPDGARARVFRLLRIAVVTITVTTLLVPALIGAGAMWFLLHPPCQGSNIGTPEQFGLAYREVRIPASEGGIWDGYYLPGSGERAAITIIVPPAYIAARGGQLYEAVHLVRAGYSALTFESVVCARGGVHSLGPLETAQIEDAIAYLEDNPDGIRADLAKIALHGFSSAGASSLFAAARRPDIAAVLAEGNYYDLDAYLSTGSATNLLEALMVGSARLTYRLSTRQDPEVLAPIQAIPKIPPRPIFLIYGALEAERGGGRKLLAAAQAAHPQAFARLWIVEGVEHGKYQHGPGGADEYARYVVSFYDCALMSQCEAWEALWQTP
jgi:dienelactone hydrolase